VKESVPVAPANLDVPFTTAALPENGTPLAFEAAHACAW
jgi:hypothetical protein